MGKTLKLIQLLETEGLADRVIRYAKLYGVTAAMRNWNISRYFVEQVIKIKEKKDG